MPPGARRNQQFFVPFMLAHIKRKATRRKKAEPARHRRASHPQNSVLAPARPPVQEDDLPKEDEEPKPEDLAKEEEALKAAELEEATAAPEPAEPEEHVAHK